MKHAHKKKESNLQYTWNTWNLMIANNFIDTTEHLDVIYSYNEFENMSDF